MARPETLSALIMEFTVLAYLVFLARQCITARSPDLADRVRMRVAPGRIVQPDGVLLASLRFAEDTSGARGFTLPGRMNRTMPDAPRPGQYCVTPASPSPDAFTRSLTPHATR